MGSSPGSAREDGASEAFVSPRSKIRAMLARIDDSEDDDIVPTMNANSTQTAIQHANHATRTPSGSANDGDVADEEDEQEEDIVLPRGRLAGRMRAAELANDQSAESSDHEGAYERMKRELQAEQEKAREALQDQRTNEEDNVPQPAPMRRMLFNKKKFSAPLARATSPSANIETSDPIAEQDLPHESQQARSVTAADGFVSQSENSQSDSAPAQGNERFKALVAKKRAERKERERKEQAERAKRQERMQQNSDKLEEMIVEGLDVDDKDAANERLLSTQTKPTRKASKKAIEAMNRETQRMSRNMQLAHAATTRKKITKESLFAKFNFRQPATNPAAALNSSASSPPGTSRPASDEEREHQTPPTSPATPPESVEKNADGGVDISAHLDSSLLQAPDALHLNSALLEEGLPDMDDILSGKVAPITAEAEEARVLQSVGPPQRPLSAKARGKQKADPLLPLDGYDSQPKEASKPTRTHLKHFRVKLPTTQALNLSDSDSELEVAPAKPLSAKFDAIIAKAPQARNTSNNKIKFRALAHLTSPSRRDKRTSKASVPVGQMQMDLQRKAREQIVRERQERLDELRAQGVIIQTAEERERDQMVTEDLLDKARQEVEALTKKEKAERKADGEDGANADAMEIDDSEDESFVGSGSDDDGNKSGVVDDEDDELELSGEDEEEEEDEDEHEGGVELGNNEGLFDNEAAEDDDEVSEQEDADADNESEGDVVREPAASRRNRNKRIIDDDDDEGSESGAVASIRPEQGALVRSEPTSPVVVNPFGNVAMVNPLGAGPMGLTQAFAATMESQAEDDSFTQESSAFVAPMPEPDLPVVDQAQAARDHNQPSLFSLDLPTPSLPATQFNTQRTALTQDFEMPDPTQDAGLIATSPIIQRFASVPPSTVDTVLVNNPQPAEVVNPNLKRKGRLLRRSDLARVSDDENDEAPPADVEPAEPIAKEVDVFAAMRKAEKRRQQLEEFNKKKSAAKGVVDEQAQESEDEYAGLGGASDDESGGEMDEETKKMLDDETPLDLNESQLAAFHADKERASDEKAIEKLYKDINSGMLRRKRGTGAFDDLSDSDDEAERRQRMKRAEFARMRKALLADENVGKIAENPKKAAFLKALEDRDDNEDFGFGLDDPEPAQDLIREDSMQEVPNSQPETTAAALVASEKRKRPLEEADPNARLPPGLRRTKPRSDGYKKPTTIADIRENVSFLIEDSRTEILVPATQSDNEDGSDTELSASRFAARRAANSVIDRLSLKRAESANSNGSGGAGGKVAFFTKGRDEQGFRVPSLLKRSTTLSSTGEVTYATERTAGGRDKEVKKGGTKKSSVAYFAREVERRSAVAKVEKRRANERKKAVEGRRGLLRGLGAGQFE